MTFPEVIDNTIRKAFVTCPTQAMYRHVLNLRPNADASVDLHFGSAFALGCEIARKRFFVAGQGVQEAIEAGLEAAGEAYGDFRIPDGKRTFKTRDRLIGALCYYFECWPLGEDGLVPVADGIECRFDYELPILHPNTGKPLRYAGRYDMLARDEKTRLYVVDEKTTSKLGDSWVAQWDLDAQMTGYIWSVLRKHGYSVWHASTWPDLEVMAQIRGVSILMREYGHVEIPIVRSQWMLDRWYAQLLRDVRRMVKAYESGAWDVALHSSSCVGYGRACDYAKLCLSPNPERLIDGNYVEVVWNPLAK